MQNKIEAVLSADSRDAVLAKLVEVRNLMTFLTDLTPEERKTLFKMGESGRPFVEASLNLVEQNDSFMPRSFDKMEMRRDNDLYENLFPVYVQMSQLFDAVEDTMMLVGSDLLISALDIYKNAKNNGEGENLDELVPLLGRRFKRGSKKKSVDQGNSDSPPE